MNNDSIIFIGLDTHKSSSLVAVLQGHSGAATDSVKTVIERKLY